MAIVAKEQTKGKGQNGKSFYSSASGGIYLTVVLKDNLININNITPACAVIVAKEIKKILGLDVQIKWVNDLFYNNNKVCGILAESVFKGNQIDRVVVGVGINLYSDSMPSDIDNIATTLLTKCNDKIKQELTLNIIKAIANYNYNNLDFIDFYKQNCKTIGEDVLIKHTPKYTARVIDIDNNLNLVVKRDTDNKIFTINSSSLIEK